MRRSKFLFFKNITTKLRKLRSFALKIHLYGSLGRLGRLAARLPIDSVLWGEALGLHVGRRGGCPGSKTNRRSQPFCSFGHWTNRKGGVRAREAVVEECGRLFAGP